MEDERCWLPELIVCESFADWEKYEERIYSAFKADFIDSRPEYGSKPVHIRRHPVEHGREEAFWHVTCCDYSHDGDRSPDMNRCERVKWVRAFIEHSDCNDPLCEECDGVFAWSTIYQKTKNPRVKILLEKERYVVIIEIREKYCLLITAYYIDQDHRLKKMLDEFRRVEASKNRKRP